MKSGMFASIQPKSSKPTPIFVEQGAVTEGALIVRLLRERHHSRHILLSDYRVYKFHGRRLEACLRAAGISLSVCLVPPAETSKSSKVYLQLIEQILKEGIDKDSQILTLGGGVINNLGGFLAATLYRGIGLIHLPSTLMAQLDAAIDLRQAINHPFGKNLIGCFYSPNAIVVDPQLLATLSLKHLRNGMAEALKHSLTQNRHFFHFLMDNAAHVRKLEFLEEVVRKTIQLKVSLINNKNGASYGEFLLQYGHCIGHALETVTNYSLLHGEAIAIGMVVSADIASAMSICEPKLIDDHKLILGRYKLPTSIPNGVCITSLLDTVSYDKNIRRNTPRLALLRDVGQMYKSGEEYFAYVSKAEIQDSLLRNRKKIIIQKEIRECVTCISNIWKNALRHLKSNGRNQGLTRSHRWSSMICCIRQKTSRYLMIFHLMPGQNGIMSPTHCNIKKCHVSEFKCFLQASGH